MSTLIRWEPFRELAQLQGEMSRFLNSVSDGQSRAARNWIPSIDVWETDSELVYAFDLPGLTEDQIAIEIHDDTLTVSGERRRATQEHNDRFYRFERQYGSFARGVGLPAGIDEGAISASYSNGALEVRVPKPEEAKPRRIQLGSAPGDVEGTVSKPD